MSTILVVEDDRDTSQIVKLYLGHDGHNVLSAYDGVEGLRLATESNPDLIVLDIMLPGMRGTEICKAVRQQSDVPIIMLTARVEEEDRLQGLDLGADDYVTKPFSPRELAARVKAVLRRSARDAAERGPVRIEYEKLVLDTREQSLYVDGNQIKITPTEFRIMALFMRNKGRVYSRDEIIDRVFGYDFDGYDRTVDVHISNLRSKIEDNPNKPKYITTVYGMGYRFGHG
jgi:DNA-binding response OmpR family regulator